MYLCTLIILLVTFIMVKLKDFLILHLNFIMFHPIQ